MRNILQTTLRNNVMAGFCAVLIRKIPTEKSPTEKILTRKQHVLAGLFVIGGILPWAANINAEEKINRVYSTTLTSISTDGRTGYPTTMGAGGTVDLSDDGRYVLVYSTYSNLVDGDTNDAGDIFRHDRLSGETIRVSVGNNGLQAAGASSKGAISNDGRYAVFATLASNLGGGDSSSRSAVYLRDIKNGKTVLISVRQDGVANYSSYTESDNPDISGNGRIVVFDSDKGDLIANDSNNRRDVFAYDRINKTIERVSITTDGEESNGDSYRPRVSADGRFVVYTSVATNLSPGDNSDIDNADSNIESAVSRIFLYDRKKQQTRLISKNSSNTLLNGDSDSASISPDGTWVAFNSAASNLIDQDGNGKVDVFATHTQDVHVQLISKASNTEIGNGDSSSPSVGNLGEWFAFQSKASNLVRGDTNKQSDIFLKHRTSGVVIRASVSSYGVQADERSMLPYLSANGRFVAYSSSAFNLTPSSCCSMFGHAYLTSLDPDTMDDPVIALWDGALGQRNVLELLNRGEKTIRAYIRLLPSGESRVVRISPRSQKEVVLNDLSGFQVDGKGLVYISYGNAHALSGRVSYYRAGDAGYDFAYSIPLANPASGKTFVSYNTSQSSLKAGESDLPVENWLTLTNLNTDFSTFDEESAIKFTIHSYSLTGERKLTRRLTLQPGTRVDLDGGHGLGSGSGIGQIGYHEIIPNKSNAPYTAQIVRYGRSLSGGYNFAVPTVAKRPIDDTWMGVSNAGGASNWVELQNVTTLENKVYYLVYNGDGDRLARKSVTLKARSGVHLDIGSLLGSGDGGAIHVMATRPTSLVAQSMFYHRRADGSVSTIYSQQGGATIGGMRGAAWNVGTEGANWLKVVNVLNGSNPVKLAIYRGGNLVKTGNYVLDGNSTMLFGLHDVGKYSTAQGKQGLVTVSGNVYTEMLRVGNSGGSEIDYALPSEVIR